MRLETDRRTQLEQILVQIPTGGVHGELVHEVGDAVSDGIQFVLHGLITAGLGVLQAAPTIRKVTIVVIVLMISCQVLRSWSRKYVGAQVTTRATHTAKKAARLAIKAAPPANRSKKSTPPET